ncbi:PH domain-containing protein [Candidatus Woesearchaeota archaeon]|nr:PH domain-containing protein [Candidatus Woesearchaeota archaeon]
MSELYTLRPQKGVFVNYRFVKSPLTWIFFIILLSGLFNFVFLIAGILLLAFNYYRFRVQYKKTKYVFLADKLIQQTGGLFHDKETELLITNITHVSKVLPFIENKLFDTGHVFIQAAGSSKAEVVLKSIANTKKFYDYVFNLMQHNGFKLKKQEQVQVESPAFSGVLFETLTHFFAKIFIVLFVLIQIIGESFDLLMDVIRSPTLLAGFGLLAAFVLFVIVVHSIFKFLDLINRRYTVFDDTIEYKEGFLTKHYSFMPTENLADAEVKQTIVDKIFSLYDVKISVQGAGQEILFKNMKNGKLLEENLDKLIQGAQKITKSAKTVAKQEVPTTKLEKNTEFTATYKMSFFRALIQTLIIIPFFPIWIFVALIVGITAAVTTYNVKASSVEQRYDFITKKVLEFSVDKVTAINISENFIDKWFNTITINFSSIGSHEKISFKHLKKTDDLQNNILSKFGLVEQTKTHSIFSTYRIRDFIAANSVFLFFYALVFAPLMLFFTVFVSSQSTEGTIILTGILAGIVLLPTIFILTSMLYGLFVYKFSRLDFYKDHFYFQKGFFFRNYYHVLYDNVKGIKTTKYPLSSSGSILFNVAGETMAQANNQKGQQMLMSNQFKMRYVSNIKLKDELLEFIFYNKPTVEQLEQFMKQDSFEHETVLSVKPRLANTIVPLIIISIIIPPLLFLLPIILLFVILTLKMTTYELQNHRLLKRSGILYKKQQSIIFYKIDHINKKQGFLNKVFSNGSVIVNTTGTSRAEMIVKNIKEFPEFYQKLKENY